MAQALQRAWLRRGALGCLLWPLSLIFGALAALRRAAFRLGLLKRHRIAVPVIVVGNVVAGGAGKTPVVMALVEHLRSRGLAVGVVARGYGRTTADCREVTIDTLPHEAGDEPLLIARTCGVPVFVGPGRAEAANALLDAHPATRLIVCDDGLQHYALQRDVEICVFDERGIGNGWLLPAGPLREHWPRKVDLVLSAGAPPGIGGFTVRRRLASHAIRSDGTRIPLADLVGRRLTAVAGIAKPQAFFAMLRDKGLELADALALPDHHDFAEDPAPGRVGDMLCTEKDAVKLWRVRPDAWAVPLAVEIDAEFWRALDGLVDAKLSSAHGPQTA